MNNEEKLKKIKLPDDAILYSHCSCGKLPKPKCVASFNTISGQLTMLSPVTGKP